MNYRLAGRGNSDPRDALDGWNIAQSDGLEVGDEICATKLQYDAVYCVPIPEIFEAPTV